MGMPQTVDLWTAELVRALPDDGKRHECVDGELLVSPAPNFPHQRIVGALYRRLYEYLRGTALGEVSFSPADIELDPHTLVQPDVFVVPIGAAGPPRSWRDVERLLLAVEVLSPSTARYDRVVKRGKFQRAAGAGSSDPLRRGGAGVAAPHGRRPVVLTQHGRSAAVLVDVRGYDALIERLELLHDVQTAEQQLAGRRAVSHSRARSAVLAHLR